jgi:hypothetical protein
VAHARTDRRTAGVTRLHSTLSGELSGLVLLPALPGLGLGHPAPDHLLEAGRQRVPGRVGYPWTGGSLRSSLPTGLAGALLLAPGDLPATAARVGQGARAADRRRSWSCATGALRLLLDWARSGLALLAVG